MRKLPFHSYDGAEPYLFVSYAHRDEERVFALLGALHERRCRVWYDEGIEIGANWPQAVAEHLRGAALVLVLVSKSAAASQNCRREINYAVSQRKPMLVVRLDGEELPADMGMQLSTVRVLDWQGPEETAEALLPLLDESLLGNGETEAGGKRRRRRKAVNGWFLASLVLALLLLGTALSFYGALRGWFRVPGAVSRREVTTQDRGEVSVTGYTSRLMLEMLLNSLEGDSVYLCGDNLVSDALAIRHEDGAWYIGEEPIPRGSLAEPELFSGRGIRELALIHQELRDLAGIGALPELTYLDLSDNPLEDLAPLGALPELETLRILCLPEGTALAPLTTCPRLRRVYVSYDMVDRIAPLVEAGIDVTVQR